MNQATNTTSQATISLLFMVSPSVERLGAGRMTDAGKRLRRFVAVEQPLQPIDPDDRLAVDDPSVAHPLIQLAPAHAAQLQHLARIAAACILREGPGDEHVDSLVAVSDRVVKSAHPGPVARAIAGLLEQLALRAI